MADNSLIPVASGNETFANKDIAGVKFPKHIPTDGSGAEIVPATHADLVTLNAKDFATQTTLAAVLAKLIAAPATEATLGSANTNLASILTALQAQRAETIWTDDSGVYVVRVDKGGVITWVQLDGTAGAAPGTGARPVDADAFSLTRSSYQATAAATGYSIGDLIDHFVLVNPNTGVVVSHFWINLTTELKLASAPSSANITPFSAEEAIMGSRVDAANTATNTTSVSGMSVWKQISLSIQAAAASLASLVSGAITPGTAGTPTAQVLTVQGAPNATPQPVGGVTVVQAASSTITRPADITQYTSGDLVANSVTAGSVAALQFTTLARVSGGSGVIIGAQIQKSGPIVTNAAFRLHLFNVAPTYTSAGDNSALSTVVVASAKGYLGYIDITAMVGFSDVAWGSGAPDNSRGGIPYVATAQIIYGLLEARGAYTPVSGEVITVSVDALQD